MHTKRTSCYRSGSACVTVLLCDSSLPSLPAHEPLPGFLAPGGLALAFDALDALSLSRGPPTQQEKECR